MLPLTLRQIRKAAFAADAHQQAWFRNNIPLHKFEVGDLGYIPKGGEGWTDFIVCCNVLEDGLVKFETTSVATGHRGLWVNQTYERQPLSSFELPGQVHGYGSSSPLSSNLADKRTFRWSIVVPPETEFDVHIINETLTTRANQA